MAAREHAPGHAEALLRRLRVRVMRGGLLDDPGLIAAPPPTRAWTRPSSRAGAPRARSRRALEADVAAARDPLPAARALDHKLGGPDGERRYTAPSYVIGGGHAIPGFNPVEVYETAIANLAPELPRRPRPAPSRELLDWAGCRSRPPRSPR